MDAGAVNATDTCAFPGVAVAPVGAPGAPSGVTRAVAADGGPVPKAVVAVTVNVYPTPFVKPVTTSGLDAPEAVNPPGLEVAV